MAFVTSVLGMFFEARLASPWLLLADHPDIEAQPARPDYPT